MMFGHRQDMTRRVQRFGAVVLVAVGVLWLLVNKSVGEGPTLLVLGGGHGVTASDLLSLPAFVIAAVLWWRSGKHRRGSCPESDVRSGGFTADIGDSSI
jgi:hypothetical protein